jgi:hypothetical protein
MEPLADAYAALLEDAREGVGAAAWGPHASEAGGLYESLVDAFEGLAHANALLHFDAEQVRADFTFAAGARRQFLQLCARDGVRPREFALSRTHALFCAVAARDDALAADLVRLGPTAWTDGAEYEDDFCFHAAVARLAVPTADALPPLDALLARLLAVGGPAPRLDAVRALADGDAPAFRDAFLARLDERALFRDELYEHRRDQPLFLTSRHVFTEGLALLALAESRGIAMPDVYAFCPEVARLSPAPPVRDLFADLVPFLRASRVERGLPA